MPSPPGLHKDLDPHVGFSRVVALGVARVDNTARLHKQDAALGFRSGAVFNTGTNYIHLTGSEHDLGVPELKRHRAIENNEDLVRIRMGMPHELPQGS